MRILELFAGYGSQALALRNLSIDFSSDISEIDPYAVKAYNQIHGETHNWGDITKIDETKLPYYDLITYSSPCQDFSVAGLGKGGDVGSGTRSSLLWECERIIKVVKPKYLLMENVKNLVGKKHKHNFIRWLRVLETIGYRNFWAVLNAKDYGVPQNRERVFVVSILGGGQYLFPNKIKLEKRLKDVLEHNVDEKYYLSDKLVSSAVRDISLTIRCGGRGSFDKGHCWDIMAEPLVCASRGRNPDNPSNRTLGIPTEQRLEINKSGCSNALTRVQKDNYVIEPLLVKEATQKGYAEAYEYDSVSLDYLNSKTRRGRVGKQMSNTLTCFCNVGVVEKYRIRKLTPRECWRLMGVRDEQYNRLHDISNTQLYKLAGNSIVVDVLMGIFKNLLLSDEGASGQLILL